jgi:hypothetical protein
MSEIYDLNFRPEDEAEDKILYTTPPRRYPTTEATRKKLYEAAKIIGEMWCNLDSDEQSDDYDPDDQWRYRGGVMMLTFKGGFTEGWVDLTYNEALTDIFYGHRWAHQKYNWGAVGAEMDKDAAAKEAEHKAQFEAEEAKRKAELTRLEATPGTPENVAAFLNEE